MTLQERLRAHKNGVTNSATWDFIADEAADALDAQDKRIKELEGALCAAGLALGDIKNYPHKTNCVSDWAKEAIDVINRVRAREALK